MRKSKLREFTQLVGQAARGRGAEVSVAALSCFPAARLERTRFAWSALASRFARAFAAPTTLRSAKVRTALAAPAAASTSAIVSAPFA